MKHALFCSVPALALLLLPACGSKPGTSDPRSAEWNPARADQAVDSPVGTVRHGRSEFLTMWHGVDTSLLRVRPEPVLGDNRDALLVRTPSQLQVGLLEAARPRRLLTAVRRSAAHPATPTLVEVFWQAPGQAPRSLHQERLAPAPTQTAEPWTALEVELPQEGGELLLVARDPRPLGADTTSIELAWAYPLVLQEPAPASDSPLARLPDVLLLTIDSFRADALAQAPGLQSWFAAGTVWTQAIAPSNWTLPAYASLFTGLPADRHLAGRGPFAPSATEQAENRQLSAVDPSLPTLAETFRQAGYATAMVHQNPMLETWTGLARGFERYVRASDRTADVLDLGSAWWAENRGRPRFLVLHFMAPHLPYRFGPGPDPLAALPLARFFGEDQTPEARAAFFDLPAAAREIVRQRYQAEVRQLDAEVSPWLEQLASQAGRLLVALHADHGEELWDDGSFEHGHSFTDSVIRVPVAIRELGVAGEGQLTAAVPAEGLAGTLLDRSGIAHHFRTRLEPPPARILSQMPLYRAALHARGWQDGQEFTEPFTPQLGSGGNGAPISEQKRQMLIELGYLAAQESVPLDAAPPAAARDRD